MAFSADIPFIMTSMLVDPEARRAKSSLVEERRTASWDDRIQIDR
jgi:hypothetical protein